MLKKRRRIAEPLSHAKAPRREGNPLAFEAPFPPLPPVRGLGFRVIRGQGLGLAGSAGHKKARKGAKNEPPVFACLGCSAVATQPLHRRQPREQKKGAAALRPDRIILQEATEETEQNQARQFTRIHRARKAGRSAAPVSTGGRGGSRGHKRFPDPGGLPRPAPTSGRARGCERQRAHGAGG